MADLLETGSNSVLSGWETIVNRIKDIEKKRAHSQSMNKWIGVIQEALDLEVEGSTPTEKMKDLIEQLKQLSDDDGSLEEIDRFVQKAILTWYRIGARRGAAELVKLLYEKRVLNDKIYDELPERIEWTKGLRYNGFDGEKHRVHQKNHSIKF